MQPEAKGIAGHEGASVVAAVGDDMHHKWRVGDRAGIKWIWSICGECEYCTNGGGEELHCPNQKDSGVTCPRYVPAVCREQWAIHERIPDGMSDEEAVPIMCGDVTAYSACKRSGVRPGQWIVLPGAGRSLGQLAVQYCKTMVRYR
jgi:alcohol dehydrogenase, propanol-preferring